MIAGRNDPCPCGSGKKYKRCCLEGDRADEPAAQHSPVKSSAAVLRSQPFRELQRYVSAFRQSIERLTSLNSSDCIAAMDSMHTRLDWGLYVQLIDEIRESLEILLLPAALPGVIGDLPTTTDTPRLLALFERIATSKVFDEFEVNAIDIYKTELAPALRHDDYSFHLPTAQPFPLLLRRNQSNECYAPQYVVDCKIFSPSLNDSVCVPMLVHSCASSRHFAGKQSFVHESIHVLQRVLRKDRIPCYRYRDGDQAMFRNPEAYVKVGLEDELEVQRIMVAAGYSFALKPILHHKNNLESAFSDLDKVLVAQYIRSGIDLIEFAKYDGLYEGDLKEAVLSEMCEDSRE